MELLSFLLQTSRKIAILAVVATTLSGLGIFAVLVFVRHWLWHGGHTEAVLLWGFAAASLAAVAAQIVSQLLLVRLSRQAVTRLTLYLSEQVLATPLERLENLGPAGIQTTLTHDVQRIRTGLEAVPRLCATLALLAACLTFLGFLSSPVLAAVLAFLAVGLLVQCLLLALARRRRPPPDGQEILLGQFRHLVEGVRQLKLHWPRRQAFLHGSLRATVEFQEKQGSANRFSATLSQAWARLLFFGLLGFILFGVPRLLDVDKGTQGLYVIIVFFLWQPVASCTKLFPALRRAQRSVRRLKVLGANLAVATADPAVEPEPLPPWTTLELRGVTHGYQGEHGLKPGFTLGPLDLTFRRGEIVFLGGANASGKTTLIKLLTGLYGPLSGQILLDGRIITLGQLESYRQLFTAVFSRYHHFPELIGVGSPDLKEKAQEYLGRLQLEDKVKIRRGTVIALRLSRGQRKRLALLVAYLEDRPFCVFDEWAADQEAPFKDVFYTEILPDLKSRGKAVLVITHDEHYFHLADRLLFLEDGKLLAPASAGGMPGTDREIKSAAVSGAPLT